MKSRNRFATSLALCALMILPLAAAVSAQGPERSSNPTRLPFSGYMSRMIGSSEIGVSAEADQVLNQFFEFLNEECAEAARADGEALRSADTWYMSILWNLREELWQAEAEWQRLAESNRSQKAAQLVREMEEIEFTAAVVGVAAQVVGACIDERRKQLEGAPTEAEENQEQEPAEAPPEAPEEEAREEAPGTYKEVYRTWTARCEAADGIEPPFAGLFTLLLPGDGSVQGVLRPSYNNVGLEYAYLEPSTLNRDGSFRLATPAGASNQVEVVAPAHRDPPASSGTIRMSGVKEGYGAWSCTGTWTDQ